MQQKILCTGNPSVQGIAKCVKELIPQTEFISRSNGYDLTSVDGLNKFTSLIHNYNIFINHSQLPPNGQETLLDIAAQQWTTGHIITIGSVLEFDKWSWIDTESAEAKKILKQKSLNLLSEKIKTTYIIVGGLKSNDSDYMRLDPFRVAQIIKFVLDCDFNLPLIYVDEISDELTNHWLSKKD